MQQTLTVQFKTDSEGFVSQECPSCRQGFKVKLGEESDKPIAFCPYCSHYGEGCWWTPAQAEYIAALAGDEVVGPELDKMAADFNRKVGRKGGLFSMSMTVDRSKPPSPPDEPEEDWPTTNFECCGEVVKHEAAEKLHCIICGLDG